MLRTDKEHLELVSKAALPSIDLILRRNDGRVVLGLRKNRPAKGCWFPLGGIINKDERLNAAFARISLTEANYELHLDDAERFPAFEHFYPDNFANVPGIGTHYVVTPCFIEFSGDLSKFPLGDASQHSEYRWWSKEDLLASQAVHDNAKQFFASSEYSDLEKRISAR